MKNYFTKGELTLWFSSMALIIASYFIFNNSNYLTLAASIIGVTALVLTAKGNPLSQVLMIIFCLLYTYISWTFSYYGEMLTYLGMSLPMSFIVLISWLKNPFKGKKSEVAVSQRPLSEREKKLMWKLTIVVTIVFYFILKFFNTANLIVSTFSISTSFMAVFLSSKRNPYFALAYAANDIVLIVLWVLASFTDSSYISVVVCFLAFLANDIYTFINWKRIAKKQKDAI